MQKFSWAGTFLATFGTTGSYGSDNTHFSSPFGVAVDGSGNVYVANAGNDRVQKFSSAGTLLATLGTAGVTGSDNTHFSSPFGVAVDGSGNMYVADTENQRVQKFTQYTDPPPAPVAPAGKTIYGTAKKDVKRPRSSAALIRVAALG